MKVRDLTDDEFKNQDVKKVEASARLEIYLRKQHSLNHQKRIIEHKKTKLATYLRDKGIAFPKDDPRYLANRMTHPVGVIDHRVLYIIGSVENKRFLDFVQKANERIWQINRRLKSLERSIKGTQAAITRKRNQSY